MPITATSIRKFRKLRHNKLPFEFMLMNFAYAQEPDLSTLPAAGTR